MGDTPQQCMRRCRSQVHGAAIMAAISRGTEEESVAYMKWLCSNCALVMDRWGRTALHMAASKGKGKVIEWLVKHRDAILNARDYESGYTALHRSVFYGQIHVAVSLIKLGANMCALDKEDLTPVEHAMKSRLPFVEFTRSGPSEAYIWGTNVNYNLGLGNNQQSRATPELVEFFRRSSINIKQVALHTFHSVFVSDTGRVFSCGHGQGGRLGQDSEKPSLIPQPVKLPATEICVQASIGSDHTVLLMESGAVWTCGSNKHQQLGHSPPPKALFAPRPLPMRVLPGKVLGVCTGRFHTVIWSKEGVRTCGLNAGQLGHPKGDTFIAVPKQVQALQQEDCHITHVAASDAATVVVMKKGTILVLHEHRCRTIASRMLHVQQVTVTGGRLDSDVEQSCEELRVCVLTTTGQLMLWQQSTQQLTRCMLQLKRLLIVTDIAMTNQQLFFATQDGQVFDGFIQPRKKSVDSMPKGNHDEEWEHIRVRALPNVHRAVSVSCDPRGRNFAVVQSHPKTALFEIPQVESSNMREQMNTLLSEACEEDDIHDIVFEVCGRRFAAHRCIVGARSEILSEMMSEVDAQDDEAPTIKLTDVKPEIFEQILQFIYTNQCNLLIPGPCSIKFSKEKSKPNKKQQKSKQQEESDDDFICHTNKSAFQVYHEPGRKINKSNKWKGQEGGGGSKNNAPVANDPLRGVAASARHLGLPTLSKALDTVQYRDGMIETRSSHDQYKPAVVQFDLAKLGSLCDITVLSLEGTEFRAHRSILAARLEYFHSMFAHGWAEASKSAVLTMALPSTVLEVLLHFLYQDEAPQVSEDPELARTMLIVADQMFIDRLKESCECALANILTLRNAPELLQLAATYNAPQLKLCCMQYIIINLSAFIEARSLEDLEWEVLEDLSKYYREVAPCMWRRTITPYDEEPLSAELESVALNYPVNINQECNSSEHKEFLEIKKAAKAKKQKKIRRLSSSEGKLARSRKESVSSNASDCSEDLEKSIQPLPLEEMEEDVIMLRRITPDVSAEPPVVKQVKREEINKWNNTFPDLNTALAAVDINGSKPKISDKKVVKISQKQKKRLISEQNGTSSPLSPVSPSSPRLAWGVQSSSPGAIGLNDIMNEEKSRGSSIQTAARVVSNAIPVPLTRQRQISVSSPQSPPGQVWGCLATSPVSPNFVVSAGQPSLEAIVADELQQRKNLHRVLSKPLHLTQIEDKAIDELMSFYNAHSCSEERITVRRVESGAVAAPTWVSAHR